MKTVYLDGKRVVVSGFSSLGEVDAARETIKTSWPCCRKQVSYKPDISAIMVVAPTVIVAREIAEAIGQLFSIT